MATKHSKAIPNRNLRIASQIARDLGELIPREVHDPRALLVTITDVELTPDYAHAKIFFTTLSDDGEAAREALQAKAGWLHSLLFKRLSIHTVPMLHFVHDRSVRDGAALSQLIDQAQREPRRRLMATKTAWRAVDGVLLIDKPTGITSTAALGRARRALRAEKGGHTGTLDPMASGLLPLCFGEATKFAADLLEADKSYAATMRLGVTTDSGDADGVVTSTTPVDTDVAAIAEAVARYRGPISQVPPMHSALKRDGRPLYEYARRGIVVERSARAVTIHRLEVVAFDGTSLSIVVHCSKGTYIRVLAEDIGAMLGCGAHLTALRRTGVGDLTLESAIPLDRFEGEDEGDRPAHLLPVDRLIRTLPRIDLDPPTARRFLDGQRVPCDGGHGRVRVYRADGGASDLLGTGQVGDDHFVAPVRLVAPRSVDRLSVPAEERTTSS